MAGQEERLEDDQELRRRDKKPKVSKEAAAKAKWRVEQGNMRRAARAMIKIMGT